MGAYKRYKVIDHVQNPEHEQWLGSLVQKSLRKAKINADVVEIIDMDPGKCFNLKVDGKKYVLFAWDYAPYMFDSNDLLCAETVDYALHEEIPIEQWKDNVVFGSPGPLISSGSTIIKWDNNKVRERLRQTGLYGENEDPLHGYKKRITTMKYCVTYTTTDKKTRYYIWDLEKDPRFDEDGIDYETISYFIRNKQWPSYATRGSFLVDDWGLNPVDSGNIENHRPSREVKMYEEQWETYCLAQRIAMELANECTENAELREMLFREAKIQAAAKDGISIGDVTDDCEVGHIGALNNTIYAANFHFGLRNVQEKACKFRPNGVNLSLQAV